MNQGRAQKGLRLDAGFRFDLSGRLLVEVLQFVPGGVLPDEVPPEIDVQDGEYSWSAQSRLLRLSPLGDYVSDSGFRRGSKKGLKMCVLIGVVGDQPAPLPVAKVDVER